MWVFWFFLHWFCSVHSVSDGDSLLSPKGVNYEGPFWVLNFFLFLVFFFYFGWYCNNSGCFDVGEERAERL